MKGDGGDILEGLLSLVVLGNSDVFGCQFHNSILIGWTLEKCLYESVSV